MSKFWGMQDAVCRVIGMTMRFGMTMHFGMAMHQPLSRTAVHVHVCHIHVHVHVDCYSTASHGVNLIGATEFRKHSM